MFSLIFIVLIIVIQKKMIDDNIIVTQQSWFCISKKLFNSNLHGWSHNGNCSYFWYF